MVWTTSSEGKYSGPSTSNNYLNNYSGGYATSYHYKHEDDGLNQLADHSLLSSQQEPRVSMLILEQKRRCTDEILKTG